MELNDQLIQVFAASPGGAPSSSLRRSPRPVSVLLPFPLLPSREANELIAGVPRPPPWGTLPFLECGQRELCLLPFVLHSPGLAPPRTPETTPGFHTWPSPARPVPSRSHSFPCFPALHSVGYQTLLRLPGSRSLEAYIPPGSVLGTLPGPCVPKYSHPLVRLQSPLWVGISKSPKDSQNGLTPKLNVDHSLPVPHEVPPLWALPCLLSSPGAPWPGCPAL